MLKKFLFNMKNEIKSSNGDFFSDHPVPPMFVSIPTSIAVEENQNVTFTCLARGLPLPNITWSKVGESLPVEAVITEQGSLLLLEVWPKDSGNYSCTASNLAGEITSPAVELVVHLTLTFTMPPPLGPISIYTGDSLTLPCTADSDLVPTMGWHMQYSQGVEIFPNNTLFIAFAEVSHEGLYVCTANNSFRALEKNVTLYVHALPSCRDIKNQQLLASKSFPMDTSGYYVIDPDGEGTGEERFKVFCDMTMYNNNGVTVISHDSENRTLVDGYEEGGSYSRIVTYTGVNPTQIVTLVGISRRCFQFIKFECFGVELFGRDMAWWVSRDGTKMNYWGGAKPDSGKCACGMNRSCVDRSKACNCDSERPELLEDSGFLSDKSTLPVSEMRFGDTGDQGEKGYHTLGKFMCVGYPILAASAG